MLSIVVKVIFPFVLLFALSCSEKTTLVVGNSSSGQGPPGLTVASERALENGKKHLRKGRCDKAIKEFNKALDKDPRNFEALYWLGVAEGICGYYSRAYDRLIVALRYSPDRGWQARVQATIGIALLYMGRDDEAITHFERARVLDPGNEIVIAYYDWEGKVNKKPKIKKKPKDREGFEMTLKWLD